jgi:hypothetical protein
LTVRDCEYALTFTSLRSIKATCAEQVEALMKTIEVIDNLMPQEKSPPTQKKAKASR